MTKSDDRETEGYASNAAPGAEELDRSQNRADRNRNPNAGLVNDHELLSAYSHGDELAFETLVEKYFRMVFTVAARQTGDLHLAEEIAQSVFLILSRKAQSFSVRASIPGWLLRTTRFVCWDAIKMRRRRQENERKFAVNVEPQFEARPNPSQMELLLEEAIQALHPDEQAGIVARFFEGRDFPEIAQMFAITEDAARKRTSRCVAKLQNFMTKRGAKVSAQTLSALLLAPPAHQFSHQVLLSALQTAYAAWKGKVVTGSVVVLATHAARGLRRRLLARLLLKAALPLLLIVLAAWPVWEWNQTRPDRIERLGAAWGALDLRIAQHRQFLMQTSPNTPNYQARVQDELAAISRDSSRIIAGLNPLLAPPNERTRLAQFLTAELAGTLNLSPAQRATVLAYIQNRLAQGATLKAAMTTLAQTTPAEAADIEAMLSPAQRQVFDQIYAADGVLLFSYPKAVALGTVGP